MAMFDTTLNLACGHFSKICSLLGLPVKSHPRNLGYPKRTLFNRIDHAHLDSKGGGG